MQRRPRSDENFTPRLKQLRGSIRADPQSDIKSLGVLAFGWAELKAGLFDEVRVQWATGGLGPVRQARRKREAKRVEEGKARARKRKQTNPNLKTKPPLTQEPNPCTNTPVDLKSASQTAGDTAKPLENVRAVNMFKKHGFMGREFSTSILSCSVCAT